MRKPRVAVYQYVELSYKAKKTAREEFKLRTNWERGEEPSRRELLVYLRVHEFTVDGHPWDRAWERPCELCKGTGIIAYMGEGKAYHELCTNCHGFG